MINKETEPAKLVSYNRDGLIEKEHCGYIVRCDKIRVSEKIGEDKNYPFYLRSCAKPLQTALIIDYELDKKFNLTDEEITICAASHSGEKVHVNIVKNILDKLQIAPNKLKCGNHEPYSITAQKDLIIQGEKPSNLHNNCSGMHAMMVGLCRVNDWDIGNYDNINHPLQNTIKNKIYELCEVKTQYPITKDGCGVPIHSMPLENIAKGYLNLFCNPKYERIKNAFLNHPYIVGGENRTDTKIMENSKNLIAKVAAGGICVVVNTELEEAFVIKLCDGDISAREILSIDLINNLRWADIDISHDIKTHNGEKIGEVITHL